MAAGGKGMETVQEVLQFLSVQSSERASLATKILSLVECGLTEAIPQKEVLHMIKKNCEEYTQVQAVPNPSLEKRNDILEKWIEINERVLKSFRIGLLKNIGITDAQAPISSHEDFSFNHAPKSLSKDMEATKGKAWQFHVKSTKTLDHIGSIFVRHYFS